MARRPPRRSNIGSSNVLDVLDAPAGPGGEAQQQAEIKERVMGSVRAHFRPEFINRVDDFIVFDPLVGLRPPGAPLLYSFGFWGH